MDWSEYAMIIVVAAMAEFAIYFSLGAIFTCVTIGVWLKVKFFNRGDILANHAKKRLPIIISSIIFSLVFANPWIIMFLLVHINSILNSQAVFYMVLLFYFWLLSSAVDYVIMKFLPKWSRLRWLGFPLRLKSVVSINLAVAIIAFSIGICCRKCGPVVKNKLTYVINEWLNLEEVNGFRNSMFTTKAEFNPRSNDFAVVLKDGTVQIYNAEDSRLIHTVQQAGEKFTAIAYLPSGEQLTLGTESGKLFLADLKTNNVKFVKQIDEVKIVRLDAGANNRIVVGLGYSYEDSKENENVVIIDISTGNILSKYSAFLKLNYQDLAISSDGETLALKDVHGKEPGAYLFDVNNSTELKHFHHSEYGPLSVDISPDNSKIAVGYAFPNPVIVWNTGDGTLKWLFKQHSNWVVSLDFSNDSKFLASGAGDGSARVYNMKTGKQVGRVRLLSESTFGDPYIDSVDISSEGTLLLAATKGYIGIYRMPK